MHLYIRIFLTSVVGGGGGVILVWVGIHLEPQMTRLLLLPGGQQRGSL